MAKKKYYVVWNGYDTGIFKSWSECQQQIKGFPGAIYKSYSSLDEATYAWENGLASTNQSKKRKVGLKPHIGDLIDQGLVKSKSISVDAACSGNPGKMEYQGVITANAERIFHQGPFLGGTNNIGEFLALVHGIAYLHKHNLKDHTIYSDSSVAIKWVKTGKAKTTIKKNRTTSIIFDLIQRAEAWLSKNSIDVLIQKWETKDWGEIPADFGRK